MPKVIDIKAREILDSRGDPTVEVELITDSASAIASVPSGKSVGSHEAVELRDSDQGRYGGLGVLRSVEIIRGEILSALKNQNLSDLKQFDDLLINLDNTPHKSRLGANSILALSIAACKILAKISQVEVFSYIGSLGGTSRFTIPTPMFNFIEGAKHADNNLQIQEFMVVVDGPQFKENYRSASEKFHALKKVLQDQHLGIAVGHEGGFAPMLESDEYALKILSSLGQNKLALDMAGVVPAGMDLAQIITKYPIVSLEDPAKEDDFAAWSEITKTLGRNIMIVGDDVFATNRQRLEAGISQHLANAVIVKPNQIGTVSEAIEFVKLAKSAQLKVVASHRSGETEDTFIADFAVGAGADFVKFGAPSRGERVSKYNRLLRIEEKLNG